VREDSAEAQELKNPSRIRKEKLRRNNVIESAGENSGKGAQRRKAKVEAFGPLEILPRLGRNCASSGGSTTAARSAGERRSGPLKISTSRRKQEECARRMDLDRQI
jgi:hypothetical protein